MSGSWCWTSRPPCSTESEAEVLLAALRNLAAQGISIIFISHRLHEVLTLCDRIVTLRDGRVVKDTEAAGVSVGGHRLLDGRPRHGRGRPEGRDPGVRPAPRWKSRTSGSTCRERPCGASPSPYGRARSSASADWPARASLGYPTASWACIPRAAEVRLQGKEVALDDPRAALDAGMAFVTEDRRGVGLLLDESLDWNIAFTAMQVKGEYLKTYLGGLVRLRDEKAMRALTEEYIKLLDIKCTGPKQKAKELSGRQPAEDLPGQGLRPQARPALRVRAYPRHRRGRQGAGAGESAALQPGFRHHHRDGLQRARGAPVRSATASPSWTRDASRASCPRARLSPSSAS